MNTILLAMVLGAQTPPPPSVSPDYQAVLDGNWVLAETLLRQKITTANGQQYFYRELGFVLEKLGRPYEAMEMFGLQVSANPDKALSTVFAGTAIRYADLSRQYGLVHQAEETLRRFEVQRYHGDDRRELREFAQFESLNLPGESVAAYAASINPYVPTSQYDWPGLWHTDLAARAVRLAPQWPDAWNRLGDCLSADGWNNKAWVAYHEALRRYPSTEKQKIINVRNRIRIMERPRMVEIEDPNDPTGYRMVNVELPGKRFRDGKDPNPRSNIAWPLPGPVPPDWH